jgi:large subunit ribosomal protein L33
MGAVKKKKNKSLLVRMVSTAGTGFFVVAKRNPKTLQEKLSRNMYDPKIRKHVQFKEEKIK